MSFSIIGVIVPLKNGFIYRQTQSKYGFLQVDRDSTSVCGEVLNISFWSYG